MEQSKESAFAVENPEDNDGFEDCVQYLFQGYPSNSTASNSGEPKREQKPVGLRGKKCNIVIPPIPVQRQLEKQGSEAIPHNEVQAHNQVLEELPMEMQGAASLPLDSTVADDLINWDVGMYETEDEEDWSNPPVSTSNYREASLFWERAEQDAPTTPPLRPSPRFRTEKDVMEPASPPLTNQTWSGAARREKGAPKTQHRDEGYCPQCGEVGGHFKRDQCKASKLEKKFYADSLDDDIQFPYRREHRESRYGVYQQMRRVQAAKGTPIEKIEWRHYRTVKANHARLIKERELFDLTLKMRARGENLEADHIDGIVHHLLNRLFDYRYNVNMYQQIFDEIMRIMSRYEE